ncbi:MAG TPA: hypothetical protein VGL65_03150 [Gemmatimonadales bacterium]
MTASPHFFDASAPRPGGAPVDPAADPWGVRKAENLLTSLEGILSARVVTTPLGEVSEIHILAHAGQNPKQVVRNVESALLAHLGLKVDHRKISVAPTADVKPLQALDLGAVRDRAAQRVVLFEDLAMATVPKARRVTATVTLAIGDRSETVAEEGPDTQKNRMETAARAAVIALGRLFDAQTLALEGAQAVELFDRSFAMVGVLASGARDSRLLMGTAEVRESLEHAAVYAVLDATNRWAVAHKPR